MDSSLDQTESSKGYVDDRTEESCMSMKPLPPALLETTNASALAKPEAVPTNLGRSQRLPAVPRHISDLKLDHMAVWTEDLERTSNFLTEVLGWRRHPLELGMDDDNADFGGMKLAFIDANGLWLELTQPTTPGPGMDLLEEKGNGAIVELNIDVKDFDQNIAEMKARGIDPVGMDGNPLEGDGLFSERVMVDGKLVHADLRIAYLALDMSRGTRITLYWEYPNGVVILRDKMWAQEVKQTQTTPRLDHVVVLASDLNKTTAVYTDILNLKCSPVKDSLERHWMKLGGCSNAWIDGGQGSIWINIVAPVKTETDSPLFSDKRFGEGGIVELAVEVPDIDAFYDKMQAKGITMMAGDAMPLLEGKKSVTMNITGDRYSYFPLDKSEGMRILVFQRGPNSKSPFSRRDASRIC